MRRNPVTGSPDLFGCARDYLHHYLPAVRALSPKTVEAYRISLESYLDYLAATEHTGREQLSFGHFDRPRLKAWLAWMTSTQQYAPATVALRLSAVKSFLAYAAQEDITLIALSQAAQALKAPGQPRKPITYLTPEQLRAVLAAYSGGTAKSRRNRMLLIMLYESAARVSELTALRLGDLHLTEPGHVTLTGKRNKTRVVPLTGKTIAHLRVYLDEFTDTRAETGSWLLLHRFLAGQDVHGARHQADPQPAGTPDGEGRRSNVYSRLSSSSSWSRSPATSSTRPAARSPGWRS